MGCTSSAPMSDVNSHTTENEKTEIKDEKNEEKVENSEQESFTKKEDPVRNDIDNLECNVTKMLPTCDNIDQNLQLDRISNSQPEIVTPEAEDNTTDSNDVENDKTMETEQIKVENDVEETPHRFSTFQEVVDQVVLDSILDDIAKMPGIKEDEDKNEENDVIQEKSEEITNVSNEELEEVDDEDNPEEAGSPSQSECSRATRWEALADIAAELPPSLAVDPLTGQIFSLAK